jgi:hypothetical protein
MPEKYNSLLWQNARKNTFSTICCLFESDNATAFFCSNSGDKNNNTPPLLLARGNTTALPMTMKNLFYHISPL